MSAAREASPLEYRLRGNGRYEVVVARAKVLRDAVRAGDDSFDSLGDRALDSWWTRMALGYVCQPNPIDWARAPFRTQGERLAAIDSMLELLGAKPVHRGGWSISSGANR